MPGLEVLWERELDAEVMTGEAWDAIAQRGFDPPSIFSAYLNTLRWNCIPATDPLPVAFPSRHSPGRVSAGAFAEGSLAAASKPLHRR